MPKTKNKPGIHLYKEPATIYDKVLNSHPRWFWHITARNGRIRHPASYYDHSKKDCPLTPYV